MRKNTWESYRSNLSCYFKDFTLSPVSIAHRHTVMMKRRVGVFVFSSCGQAGKYVPRKFRILPIFAEKKNCIRPIAPTPEIHLICRVVAFIREFARDAVFQKVFFSARMSRIDQVRSVALTRLEYRYNYQRDTIIEGHGNCEGSNSAYPLFPKPHVGGRNEELHMGYIFGLDI